MRATHRIQALLIMLFVGGTAAAQEAGAPDAGSPPIEVAKDSPRSSLDTYLTSVREGRLNDAVRFLDLREQPGADGPRLARRLKAVLDRHIWFEMDQISPLSTGVLDDGLPPELEEVGRLPTQGGATEPVKMTRIEDAHGPRWAFTSSTVERIDSWYGQLKDRWVLEHLPEPLLRPGPRELLWWQWLALVLLLPVSWFGGLLLSFLSRSVARRLVARTATTWDDAIVARLGGPATLGWALLLFYLALPYVALYAPAQQFIHSVLKALTLVTLFWALLRSIDVIAQGVLSHPWASKNPASRTLVPLGMRTGKVTVFAIAVIAVLSELGYPVASLIAGLGIGGLALALAGQKTVENLFGAFSIGLDQPIREGDFVRIEDFVGTVEAIGLRSTRIRTLDRTVISIPNGRLADMRLETFAARDRIRLACTIGVTYGTTAAQMRTILSGLEKVLRDHSAIWPDAVVVRFKEFGASSLDIEVMAWFQTSDWGQFQLIRQDVLLQFMEVVESAGSSFAFPTRTVHLVHENPAPKA